jgi:poly-D-alanine transfer protein DltD
MDFEPLLIESFISIIKNFQQFSDKVEVVMLPRNTKWINYSPEARTRLNKTIAQIEAQTGVTIKDHQELDVITPEMFRDATHLARYFGDVAYTRFLLEQYLDDL